MTATTNGAFNKALISLNIQNANLLQTMVILVTTPRSSMAQLRGVYLGKMVAMITKCGAISSEEHMIVTLWDHVQDIVCSGQQAMMIMYGIGLTGRMVIGTTQHWIIGKSKVILLQVLLVIKFNISNIDLSSAMKINQKN